MGDIVNLRRARKDRVRQTKDAAAAENRARFGRSKADKHSTDAEKLQAVRFLDGHRRDADPST